jgi:spermidine synthase
LEEAGRLRKASFIGLGAGTMAAYARPGMRFAFFEIDPAVVAIAQDPACFTFVNDARQRGAEVTITLRDGRLGVAGLEQGSQDLIVVDAFSSDSVPVHLLTREAIAAYADRLAPGGLLAVHISSRTFDLKPVMRAAAEDLGLVIAVRQDDASNEPLVERESKFGSTWAVFARQAKDLGFMERNVAWEKGLPAGERRLPAWTDDRSDVVSVIVWEGAL